MTDHGESLEGFDLQPTGDFSFVKSLEKRVNDVAGRAADRADEFSDRVNLFADMQAYEVSKATDDLEEMVDNLVRQGIDVQEHMVANIETYLESKRAEVDNELGEMKELLADPINRGRLNLYLTLSAFETKDLADKMMTIMEALPPGIQEPILRFAAENPASLPLSLLAAFAMFFASKTLRYFETGEDAAELSLTGEADSMSVENIESILELLTLDTKDLEKRAN